MSTQTISKRALGGAPCKGCPDREPGCHSKCEHYGAWKAELERKKAARFQNFQKEKEAESYIIEGKLKGRASWRKKTK